MKVVYLQDRYHCTDTGFRTVENINSTLFLKELRKLWEKKDPDLPWEIGEYDESNTLLVENAPHKALLNPVSCLLSSLYFQIFFPYCLYIYICLFVKLVSSINATYSHFQPNTAIFPYPYRC